MLITSHLKMETPFFILFSKEEVVTPYRRMFTICLYLQIQSKQTN